MQPRIISLFSGAGGLDLGFFESGFDIALAIDNSKYAIQTHRRNFPETTSLIADLVELGVEGVLREVKKVITPGEDIGVIGGPPCQGFSLANSTGSIDDKRNQLPYLYLNIIESLKEEYNVEFILFENVPGIKSKKHIAVYEAILERLEDLGFSKNVDEYCALDYGVPQNRNRVIISGFSSSMAAESFHPQKSSKQGGTVRDTIEYLPEPEFFGSGRKPEEFPCHQNHWTMRPVSKHFANRDSRRDTRSFRRLEWDQPSPTVAYGHREIHVHPEGHRRLSIYEAMLLQGFPESFIIEGPLSAQVDQVSNAVPPPLASALAEATVRALSDAKEKAMLT